MWYRYMVQSRCLYQTCPTGTGKSQKVTCPSPILSFFHSFSPNLKTPLSQSHPVPPNLKTSRSQSPLSHPIRRPPCHSPTCPNLSHKMGPLFFLSFFGLEDPSQSPDYKAVDSILPTKTDPYYARACSWDHQEFSPVFNSIIFDNLYPILMRKTNFGHRLLIRYHVVQTHGTVTLPVPNLSQWDRERSKSDMSQSHPVSPNLKTPDPVPSCPT